MCNYCDKLTGWLVYTSRRSFGIKVCTFHLSRAIQEKHNHEKSDQLIFVEPIL